MTEPDDRTQAEIDADIAALREHLISVINPPLADRLRGIAYLADTSPASVFNQLLTDAAPLLDVVDAALAFTAHPDVRTVKALIEATDQLRQIHHSQGGPFFTGVRAAEALQRLNGTRSEP